MVYIYSADYVDSQTSQVSSLFGELAEGQLKDFDGSGDAWNLLLYQFSR